MNRTHNATVALVALVLLAAIMVLVCSGCTADDRVNTHKNSDRFTVERYYYNEAGMPDCYIITDTETGVQYLACHLSRGMGLTPLLPGEAQP